MQKPSWVGRKSWVVQLWMLTPNLALASKLKCSWVAVVKISLNIFAEAILQTLGAKKLISRRGLERWRHTLYLAESTTGFSYKTFARDYSGHSFVFMNLNIYMFIYLSFYLFDYLSVYYLHVFVKHKHYVLVCVGYVHIICLFTCVYVFETSKAFFSCLRQVLLIPGMSSRLILS